MFYKDLKDPDYATNFCVYHRRFRCPPPHTHTLPAPYVAFFVEGLVVGCAC